MEIFPYLFSGLGEDVPKVFDDLRVHDDFAFVRPHVSRHRDYASICVRQTHIDTKTNRQT